MATTWQDLAGLNPQISNPNLIYPGQRILLPNMSYHTVVPGDTLSGIAMQYNKDQVDIVVDPEDNLAEDPNLPDEEVLSDEEEVNIEAPEDDGEDDSSPTEADVQDFMKRHPDEESASDVAKERDDFQVGGNKETRNDPARNPLDDYSSYTYSISLFALTKNDYNNMVDNPHNFTASKCLIGGAGRYQDVRDSHFKEDFYFDSFKVSTVIGLSAGSRGTNAITMDFTVLEPYGMTLLDRIMDVAMNEIAAKNYLDMPYLLRIEFFGADDAGNMQKIASQTKNFPIKIINLKIKASTKGSEYTIQAVPFNHAAHMQSVQSIKTRMEITSTTVNDFFASSAGAATKESIDTVRASTEHNVGGGRGTARDPRILGNTPPEETVQMSVKTTSFTAAYNEWNIASTKTNDAKYADTINFVIDPEIANSKIVDPKNNTARRVGSVDPNTTAKGEQGAEVKKVDFNSVVHSFEAGTTINEVINAIIPNSEFFLKQVKDPSKSETTQVENSATSDATAEAQSKPLKMWKIIPKIKLAEYDTARNVWGKNVTFYIKTYDVKQQQDPRLPKSPPPKKPAKRYDYLYSGKNTSVLSFDIDFNFLYFNAKQIDRNNTTATAGPQAAPIGNDKDAKQDLSSKRTIAPTQSQNTGTQMQSGVGGANNRSETQNAQSALQSIYTTAGGDMISLKMQIIGDPHFIKQDDLFIAPDATMSKVTSDSPSPFVSDKVASLRMDSGEIFCYVTFRTPMDFDDGTGMFDLKSSNKYQVSEFSGYYRVLKVDSEFRNGKFTQTIEMVRPQGQDSPNTNAAQDSGVDINRKESATQGQKPTLANDTTSTDAEQPEQEQPDTTAGPDGDGDNSESPPADEVPEHDDEEGVTAEEQDLGDVVFSDNEIDISDLQVQTTQVEVDWGGEDTILSSPTGQIGDSFA